MADETVTIELAVEGLDIIDVGSILAASMRTPGVRLGSDFALDEGALFAALGMLEGMSASELTALMIDWNRSYQAGAQAELKFLADLAATGRSSSASNADKPYDVIDGIAQIPLSGLMTKHPTCMSEMFGGGSSTTRVRAMLRAADRDVDVVSKTIIGDTPGGEVAGSFDLAYDISNGRKPTDYYAEDMTASAGMIAASGARQIHTNLNGILGSLGVYTKLVDDSKRDEANGRKVHVVKAGKLKATGEPGQFSTDQMAAVQKRVDGLHGLALRTVRKGRPGMTREQLSEVADAGVFIGKEAVKIGLADGVVTRDKAHALAVENNKRERTERTTTVAVNPTQLDAWLNDTGSDTFPVPAPVSPEPTAAAVPQAGGQIHGQSHGTEPALVQALAAMGVSNVTDLKQLAQLASIGNQSIVGARANAKRLATAVFRSGDASMAATEAMQIVAAEKVIDSASHDVVMMLTESYEQTIQARKGNSRPTRFSVPSTNGNVNLNLTPATPNDSAVNEEEVITGMIDGIISSNYAPPANSSGGRRTA